MSFVWHRSMYPSVFGGLCLQRTGAPRVYVEACARTTRGKAIISNKSDKSCYPTTRDGKRARWGEIIRGCDIPSDRPRSSSSAGRTLSLPSCLLHFRRIHLWGVWLATPEILWVSRSLGKMGGDKGIGDSGNGQVRSAGENIGEDHGVRFPRKE